MPDTDIARRLMIHGLVQGVGYRAAAQAQGERLGLRGWVRNRRDGTVEALIAGPETQVDAFIEWAQRGPSHCRVQRVEVSAPTEMPDGSDFGVLPTL